MAWLEYKEIMMTSRYAPAFQAAALVTRIAPLGFAPPVGANLYQTVMEGQFMQGSSRSLQPADGSLRAAPILALKAARKAIADNPDHPDGYNALAQALGDPELPINDSERSVGMVCALRQCLSRLPPPEEIEPAATATEGWKVARQLATLYAGNPQRHNGIPGTPIDLPGLRELAAQLVPTQGGQVVPVPFHFPIDLAHDSMMLAGRYADREVLARAEDKDGRARREQILKGLKAETDKFGSARQQSIERYRQVSEISPGVKERLNSALQLRLTGEAIKLVKELPEADAQREFGKDLGKRYLQVIGLELAVGRVEDAAADLEGVRQTFEEQAASPNPPPGAQTDRLIFRLVQGQLLVLTGNYEAAGKELETTEGPLVSAPPPLPPSEVLPPGWPAVPVVPSLNTTIGLGMFYRERVGMYQRVRQDVIGKSDREAAFFFRRGWLALLAGEVEDARVRFRESRRPALPAWDVPELSPPATPLYLDMIDAAARR
jgi:hypothetical protein